MYNVVIRYLYDYEVITTISLLTFCHHTKLLQFISLNRVPFWVHGETSNPPSPSHPGSESSLCLCALPTRLSLSSQLSDPQSRYHSACVQATLPVAQRYVTVHTSFTSLHLITQHWVLSQEERRVQYSEIVQERDHIHVSVTIILLVIVVNLFLGLICELTFIIGMHVQEKQYIWPIRHPLGILECAPCGQG